MSGLSGYLSKDPDTAEAVGGLNHALGRASSSAVPRQRQGEEPAAMPQKPRRERIPKPLRYALGFPWIILLASVGWSRSEPDREQAFRWMRG